MLPRQHRLNRSADLRQVLRRGRRFGVSGATLSLILRSDGQPSRLGLVTPKIVGGSVTRHQVARRIRAAGAGVIRKYPDNLDIAVRAQAGADCLSVAELEIAMLEAATKLLVGRNA